MKRDRPFIQAGDPHRPYSEILAERRITDPAAVVRGQIALLEAEATAHADPAERKRLQCEAEELRCQLEHRPPPREF
jgi:hypothetical protein